MTPTKNTSVNNSLDGQIVLVTGGTGGIGFHTARTLGLRGAEVIITSRHQESADECVAKLCDENIKARCIIADLSTADGCTKLAQAAGDVDILINNVGIYPALRFFDTDDEQWENIFTMNLMTGVRMSRLLVPAMVKKGWGRVVFVSSETAISVATDMIAYSASKAAQAAFARGLAQELAGTGVTVNTVLAGPTNTGGFSKVLDSVREEIIAEDATAHPTDREVEQRFMSTRKPDSLIKRLLDPQEIANMISYVASPEASGTTGAALRVDGGLAHTVYP